MQCHKVSVANCSHALIFKGGNIIIYSKCDIIQPTSTMSAKSLGTSPVVYAVDEQQNPLLRRTMLCEGDTNSTGGKNDVVTSS